MGVHLTLCNVYSGNQFHSTNSVAGNQIEAANNCPAAGAGRITNCGPGAASVNSGPASGSVNNYNVSETTPRETRSEGKREDATLADRGSGRRVQRTRSDQRVYKQPIKFFFCKFPSEYDENIFRQIFRRFGEISRIFISRERDRNNNRYGFVTFRQLNDQEGLKKFDKTRLGSYNFRVYRARPYRSGRNRMEAEGNMRARDASRAVDATQSSADGLSGYMGIPEQRDDAVAVEGAWLYCCLVGCLRGLKDVGMVEKNLREQGFTFCKATHLVRDLILLECPNNDYLSTLINRGGDLLKHHFQWVKPYSLKIGEEGCRDRDEETGSSVKGSQKIGGSSKPHNNHSDDLGVRNMVSERLNPEAKPFWPIRVPTKLNAEAVPFYPKMAPQANLGLLRICNEREEERGQSRKNQTADDQVISDKEGKVVDGMIVQTAPQKCTLGSSDHERFQEMVGSERHKTQLDELGSQNMIPTTLDDSGQSDNGPLHLDKSKELYVDCGSYSMLPSTSNENGDNKGGAVRDLIAKRGVVLNLFYGSQAPNSSPPFFTYLLLLILFLTHVVANLLVLSDNSSLTAYSVW